MYRSLLTICAVALASTLHADPPVELERLASSVREQYGYEAGKRGQEWLAAVREAQTQASIQQLETINDYFNQFLFADDDVVWGQEDYWATPIEFIGRGAGDCEDYSIAKYFSLVEAGFPADKLRLMYVKAVDYNQHHMVLTYYPKRGAEPLVLDNLNPIIKPAGERPDLVPIYSFNADFLWLAKTRGEAKQVGKADRLSLWQDLQQRYAAQATKVY